MSQQPDWCKVELQLATIQLLISCLFHKMSDPHGFQEPKVMSSDCFFCPPTVQNSKTLHLLSLTTKKCCKSWCFRSWNQQFLTFFCLGEKALKVDGNFFFLHCSSNWDLVQSASVSWGKVNMMLCSSCSIQGRFRFLSDSAESLKWINLVEFLLFG